MDNYIQKIFEGLGFNDISEFENYLTQNDIEIKDLRKKLIIEKTWNTHIYETYHKK